MSAWSDCGGAHQREGVENAIIMGDNAKVVVGYETNSVPDLNKLLDEGETPIVTYFSGLCVRLYLLY